MNDPTPPLRLLSLRLIDFKSFVDETVEIEAPLTLLVGGNASGKSNFLDALRFLQGVAAGLSVADVLEGSSKPPWPGLRGGIEEAVRARRFSFSILSGWELPDGRRLEHRIRCSVSPRPEIPEESLWLDGEDAPLFRRTFARLEHSGLTDEAWGPLTEPFAVYGLEARYAKPEFGSALHFGHQSSLVQFIHSDLYDPEAVWLTRALRETLVSMRFTNFDVAQMRGYASIKVRELGDDGANLSAAAFHLCGNTDQKQDLADWLSELCSPRIADIGFIEVPQVHDVILYLVEEDGTKVSAKSLSDGTLRFLALLVTLKTARRGEIILLEEPETGLHPARAALLTQLLLSIAASRGCHVIATTHSPLVLLALGAEDPTALGRAIVFGRRPDAPGTVMRRLADLPDFEEIAARRGVDHLFTTEWLERSL